MNLYDYESINAWMANWSDRLQGLIDQLNGQTQKRIPCTLGENASAFAAVYINGGDGKAYNAQATAGKMPAVGLLAEGGVTNDQPRIITFGMVENAGWAWTPQALLAIDSGTAGNLVEVTTPAIGPQTFTQVVAIALTATKILVISALAFRMNFQPGSYTVAGKPAAGDFHGHQIFITDAGTTGRFAYWAMDGVWRYVKDDSAV